MNGVLKTANNQYNISYFLTHQYTTFEVYPYPIVNR